MKNDALQTLKNETNPEPGCDMGRCGVCGWNGPLSECPTEEDGDYESGYFTVHVCPKCEDGGELEYEMSENRGKEWVVWMERNRTKENYK